MKNITKMLFTVCLIATFTGCFKKTAKPETPIKEETTLIEKEIENGKEDYSI